MLKLYICYVIVVQKKRGDYIKKIINWQLLSNNKEVISEKVECEFDNSILKYIEKDNTINIIDLENETYTRDNEEFTFKINFKNRLFDYILKKEELSIENAVIDAKMAKDDNVIKLKYNLGEEEKEIIIHLQWK